MIRNKIIWAFIAIVTSVFFTLSFSSVSFDGCSQNTPNTAGRLYGEDISARSFQNAMFFELGMRQNLEIKEAPKTARTRTWKRLAILKIAEKLGLQTTDAEINQAIQSEPMFSPNGVFEQNRYYAFTSSQSIPPSAFEEYLRQDLTIGKIRGITDTLTWISPVELDRRFSNLTDIRTFEIAYLKKEELTPEVFVTDTQSKTFYEGHTNLFTAPHKRQVQYVKFLFANYTSQSNEASNIEEYYNNNIEDYTPKATNEFELPIPIPIDEVRDVIESIVRKEKSIENAIGAAADFVDALASPLNNTPLNFESAAKKNHLEIKLTDFFSIGSTIQEIDVHHRFKQAAFNLIPDDPEGYFSDIIYGSNAAYVIAYATEIPSRVLTFNEVIDEAMAHASSNLKHIAFINKAENIHKHIIGLFTTNSTLRDLLPEQNIGVTSIVFSVYEAVATNFLAYQDQFIPSIIDLNAGNISDLIETREGAIIAHAVQRSPALNANNPILRRQLHQTLQIHLSELIFEEYSKYLLNDADFEDLQSAKKETYDDPTATPTSL